MVLSPPSLSIALHLQDPDITMSTTLGVEETRRFPFLIRSLKKSWESPMDFQFFRSTSLTLVTQSGSIT
jgi:hypothetical protein